MIVLYHGLIILSTCMLKNPYGALFRERTKKMININKVELGGVIAGEIEIFPPAMIKFAVEIKRKKGSDGEYICETFNCAAFGKTADFITRHFSKGSSIFVYGVLQASSYSVVVHEAVFDGDMK